MTLYQQPETKQSNLIVQHKSLEVKWNTEAEI